MNPRLQTQWLTTTVTGKPCRTLRNAFHRPGTHPARHQHYQLRRKTICGGKKVRTRVERVRAKDFLTYPVGQILGDMNEETSVREVVYDLLNEMLEAKERLDAMLR